MSDFGIAISQSGIPVDKAGDTQKVLDSRWEYLNIEVEQGANISYSFASTDMVAIHLVDHSLGFLPAFTPQLTRINITGSGVGIRFIATTTAIYAIVQFSGFGTATVDVDVTVRVFDCNITQEYKAPIIQAIPSQGTSVSTFGAKALLPNKVGNGINDSTLEDFSLDVRTKAICIQQHGLQPTGTVSAGRLTLTHNFGTPPAFAVALYYPNGFDGGVYGKLLGNSSMVATINSTEGIGTADGNIITLRGAQYGLTGTFAYMLFKDPLEISL